MSEVAVIEYAHLKFAALTEFELDCALGYARTYYEQNFDRDLMRIIVNTVHHRRKPGVELPLLAATVIRENIHPPHNPSPQEQEDFDLAYRGWKGAVMLTMSIRSGWARANSKRARRRKKKSFSMFPEDKRGQLRFVS